MQRALRWRVLARDDDVARVERLFGFDAGVAEAFDDGVARPHPLLDADRGTARANVLGRRVSQDAVLTLERDESIARRQQRDALGVGQRRAVGGERG